MERQGRLPPAAVAGAKPAVPSPERRAVIRLVLALTALVALVAMPSAPVRAAGDVAADGIGRGLRLVMVDDVGCIYCRKWDAEVGPIYEQSATGRVAPLARRPKRHADLAPYEPLVYTPTFVLVRDGIEVGRIVGYAGADFFWAEFERLIARDAARNPERPPPAPQRDAARQ